MRSQERLWTIALQISGQYPSDQRETYRAAALTLRIPYWDWALNATMPTLLNQLTITVNTPNGSQTITNPLYSYVFHPVSDQDFPPSDGVCLYFTTPII